MKRGLALGLALFLLALLGCSDDPAALPADRQAASVEISPDPLIIPVFGDSALSVRVVDGSGRVLRDVPVEWSSSDSSVVAVSATGGVSARAFGSVQVVAAVSGVTDTVRVSARMPAGFSLAFRRDSLVFGEGYDARVEPVATDAQGREVPGAPVQLSSSDPEAVGVSEDGAIKPHRFARVTVEATLGDRTAQIPVRATAGWRRIYAAAHHGCGIRVDGRAFCWGGPRNGRLGVSRQLWDAVGPDHPLPVQGDHRFERLTLGEHFTCGITEEGTTLCWGANWAGALGTGRADETCVSGQQPCSDAPVAVAGAPAFVELSAGEDHACGLLADGSGLCWGRNSAGQVGNLERFGDSGEDPYVRAPVAVAGTLGLATIRLGGSYDQSRALTSEGQPVEWGRRYAEVDASEHEACDSSRCFLPRPMPSPEPVVEFVAGRYFSCGRLTSGTVGCWDRPQGASFRAVDLPEPVVSLGPTNIGTSVCGLTDSGDALCWSEDLSPVVRLSAGVPLAWISTGWGGPFAGRACAITAETNVAYCWFGDLAEEPEPVLLADPVTEDPYGG